MVLYLPAKYGTSLEYISVVKVVCVKRSDDVCRLCGLSKVKILTMVRTYKRKTTRGNIRVEVFQRAAQAVREEKISMKDAAARYGINFMTLNRYTRKSSAAGNSNNVVTVSYTLHRKVFTNDQDEELAAYVAHYNFRPPQARIRICYCQQHCHYVDETELTTVQRPSKIIATTGTKQVEAVTSAEKRQLITLALTVSASGNSIPPFLIFCRKNFKNVMLANTPPGCVGAVHSSGWMTSEKFFLFIKHFVRFARCSQEKPVLLILDNHESHLSIPVLNFCKSNGVVLFSFPPHASHKLQPLDRTVFGPLKRYFNSSADGWLKSNPGRTINIYDIPLILKEALSLALTQKNVQKGFSVTGIWPCNREAFEDDEYLPPEVTNRPINESEHDLAKLNLVESKKNDELTHLTPSLRPSTSFASSTPPLSREVSQVHQTPEDVKPYPKAAARKITGVQQEGRLRDSKRKKVSSTKKILVANSTGKQRKIAIKKIRKSESEESEDEDTKRERQIGFNVQAARSGRISLVGFSNDAA
ncbi:hypothetical protein ILUMI_22310 [Ignelater luminosus]|uniref:DDE-1 domain-containing protein n=1 Tax=Ignelater luminosus TaxID=2038154 RepID=A0A8K0CAD6_IGNLU|nr:hypothetical protein ILUMI_22310 [Ignelater luminosus]